MTRFSLCALSLFACFTMGLAPVGCSSPDTITITKKAKAKPVMGPATDAVGEGEADAPGGAAPDEPAKTSNVLAAAVDALFADAAAKDVFSGSVVVVDGGKTVLEKGFGAADRKTMRKSAPDTIFRIGSVSKQFAASAVLALVADRKIALTDPVSKYFPEYPKQNLMTGGTEVTVHHLISHTSGLPDPAGTTAFQNALWRRTIAPTEQIDFVKALPLVATPGSTFAYLNFNFMLAALIVEKVSGQSYDTFLHQRFFEPLGMKDTGTMLPSNLSARAATGYYAPQMGGPLVSFADEPAFADRDVSVAFGSGQIYSTVQDLARWDRALTGDTILPAAQRALLFTPNLQGYGYGWSIDQLAGVTVEYHNGALSPLGFAALIVRVPSKDRFVAYLANMESDRVEPAVDAKLADLVVK